MLSMDPPNPAKSKEQPQPVDKLASIEEEVKNAIEMIDSGHDSHVEWRLLNKLHRELCKRKDPRSKNLMKMIQPVMDKYGMHGVSEKES